MKTLARIALVLLFLSVGLRAQTAYFTSTQDPNNPSGLGDLLTSEGDQWNASGDNVHPIWCRIFPKPPILTLFSTTNTGSAFGLTGTVQNLSYSVVQGVVYTGSGSATFENTVNQYACGFASQFTTLTFPYLKFEVARAFGLRGIKVPGGNANEWYATDSCNNVDNSKADYQLTTLEDSNNPSNAPNWKVLAVCTKWSTGQHWYCLDFWKTASGDYSGDCTYNP